MQLDLPPDVIGHMCALGGNDEPLEMCPSCQRAVVYGVLLWASTAYGAIDAGLKALYTLDGHSAGAQFAKAQGLVMNMMRTLVEVTKTDFASQCNLVEVMTEEDYTLALQAFVHQRTEHYTDSATGMIVYESHEDVDDGDDLAPTGS